MSHALEIGFLKQMGVPIFISQVQIIALEQFSPCCVIFDEALKLNSSDGSQTNPWNLLGRLKVFLQNASQVVLFLLVELITLDQCCSVYHVAAATHDTASIIQENVLPREVPRHFSCSIFSPSPSFVSLSLSLCPLCLHLPCLMLLPVFIFD